MRKKIKKWYRLDNAAKIYPVIMTHRWSPMFRYTAVMKEMVDPLRLQQALDKTMPRFPGDCVRLRRGMFWFYLEEYTKKINICTDTNNPCMPFEKGMPLFRVLYYNNRISMEVFHAIADGAGAIIFFKTLLAEYLRLFGVDIPCTNGVVPIDEAPDPEELEDSFLKYSRMSVLPSRSEAKAYRLRGTKLDDGLLMITTGTLSVTALIQKARSYGVSITDYLAATYVYALYLVQKAEPSKKKRPVKVSIPANLRKYYKTKTLRNFSQYVNPGIDPNYGEFTFAETLDQVHHFLRFMLTEKNLNARMSKNVSDELIPALRLVPLFLKNIVIMTVFLTKGESAFTTAMSNVGSIDLPEVMIPYFERFDAMLHTARGNPIECAASSFLDTISITFSRTILQSHVERLFFQMLVREGLHVKIESNNLD